MFRKILFAFAALAAIGTAAFTVSTSIASAQGFNSHRQNHHWRPAVRFHSPSYNYASCYVRRVIHTPFGPRVQTVNICY
jgi:hypothetical protein